MSMKKSVAIAAALDLVNAGAARGARTGQRLRNSPFARRLLDLRRGTALRSTCRS
jgi:hypothetical protein